MEGLSSDPLKQEVTIDQNGLLIIGPWLIYA